VVPAETPIPLKAGWNYIGYVLREPMAIGTALGGIGPALVRATGQGQNYDPTFPPELNTLTELGPGVGYWVEVSADAALLYPDSAGRGAGRATDRGGAPRYAAAGWQPVFYPSPPFSVLGRVTLDAVEAEPGDIVGAFVGEECRGVGRVVVYGGRAYCNLSIAVAANGETATLLCCQAASGRRFVTDLSLELVSGESRGVPALPVELPFVTPPGDGVSAEVRVVSAADPTATLATVTVARGWNLISLPVDGRTVQDLAPTGGVSGVFRWSGDAYVAGAPDQPLAAGEAVWLFLTVAPRDVTVAGTQPVAVALPALSPGWNLVGTVTERTVDSLAAGAGTGAVSPVWVWDNVAKVYRPETERLRPGRGYWIWWAER
jgi:hypothetical protein